MTTDLDARITSALTTIAGAARADRDAMLTRVLREGGPRTSTRTVGPFRPVTVAAGALVVAAAAFAVVVVTGRESVDAPAATASTTTMPAPTTTSVLVPPNEQVYTVVAGDSLMAIAQRYCVTFDELIAENEWTDGSNHSIFPGDSVRVPASGCAPGTGTTTTVAATPETAVFDPTQFNPDGLESPLRYVATPDDTTSSLAYQLCTSVPALAAWNQWSDDVDHVLVEGELVAVPNGSCIRGSSLIPADADLQPPEVITVIGDSEASRIGSALSATGAVVSDLSQVSSGLARPDYYDWPSTITQLLPTLPAASPVVMVIGSNDGQALLSTDGTAAGLQTQTQQWFAEYMARVEAVATTIVAAGHPLVWVGVHGSQVGQINQDTVNINDATDYALEKVPGALYITAWDVLRGPDGASPSETVLALDGTVLTALDPRFGGTLTDAAVELLSQRVEDALRIGAPPNG